MSKLFRLFLVSVLFVSWPAASPAGAGTAGCSTIDGGYQIGCRLIPGRADGWFSTASTGTEPLVASVRIDERYR